MLTGEFIGRPMKADDLEKESTVRHALAEDTSEKIVNTRGLFTSSSLANEFKTVFQHLQFKTPHQELKYFEKTESSEKSGSSGNGSEPEIARAYVDFSPRRPVRLPIVLEGKVDLLVPTEVFVQTPYLLSNLTRKDSPALSIIPINLSDLILKSSENTSNLWERAIKENEK